MGEGGTAGGSQLVPRPRRGPGVFFLRLVAALLVVVAGTALTRDLARKSTDSPPRARPPAETPAPESDDERTDRQEGPRYVAVAGQPTVYDAIDDVDECVATSRRMGPASDEAGFDDDIRKISRRVERVRRLAFERGVDTRLVSRAEVGARFARGYRRETDPQEAAGVSRTLALLGLLEPGTDLSEETVELVEQGTAGFYSPRRETLYAAASGAELTPFEEVVLAHELEHALIDQALGLPGTLSRDPLLADVMLAHSALIEGDATLAMTKYAAARLPAPDLEAFLRRFGRIQVERSEIPYMVARGSEFPYYEGLLFACAAWKRGGWDAVDEMYARPPATTAEVVFPDRYRQDVAPRLPPSPRAPRGKWKPLLDRSFGVFDLMLLLENADLISTGQTVPGSHAGSVRGWDGGVIRTWGRGPETIVHIALVDAGVERPDGSRRRRLCRVLRGWFEESFPEEGRVRGVRWAPEGAWVGFKGYTGLSCDGASVQLAIAPDDDLARRLLRR